jgi:hypothetical protein
VYRFIPLMQDEVHMVAAHHVGGLDAGFTLAFADLWQGYFGSR